MSEVERFNEYTWGVTEDEHGEYVRYADYDALKGAHLMIKLDGESKPRKFHPTWELQYLSEQA